MQAGETYWVKGRFATGCPFYFPYFQYILDNIGMYAMNNDRSFRKMWIHNDTVFFVLENATSFGVEFVNLVPPLCESPSGSATASVVNGGVPPYLYKWSNGSEGVNLINAKASMYSVHVTDSLG